MCVKWKSSVTGDRKIVHREGVKHLSCLYLRRHRARTADLRETVRNVQNEDDQDTVGRAFDLEISKQGVGAEEVYRLIEDIRALWVSLFRD